MSNELTGSAGSSANLIVSPGDYRSSQGTGGASYTASFVNDWWFDTTGTASTTNVIWTAWNTQYTSVSGSSTSPSTAVSYTRRSAGLAAPRANMPRSEPAVHQAAYQPDRGTFRMMEIETAKTRAEGLLREHLSERQRADLNEKGYFEVCAVNFREGIRRYYRIRRGRAGNVALLDGPGGREVKKLCCHPLENVPDADTMLSQKLMLEHNEALFLKLANITDLATGRFERGQGLQAAG